MEPVLALAIVLSGVFAAVLITALFYVWTVRPRLAEPGSPRDVGAVDEWLHEELVGQRMAVEKLSTTLAEHTEKLSASAAGTVSGEAMADLHGTLSAQTDAVQKLNDLFVEQSGKLTEMDARLESQNQKLDRLESALGSRPNAPEAELTTMIQAQADKLVQVSARLDEWATTRAHSDEKLTENARLLAELDRELAAQAQTVRLLDTKVSEHTTMLLTAATERREQAGLLQRIFDQIGQMVPTLNKAAKTPVRPGQDRLTDINGIGPVYASKLYEAGIQTFRQLASVTPEEIDTLLNLPQWRKRSVDAPSWIEQAAHLASQREKVENS